MSTSVSPPRPSGTGKRSHSLRRWLITISALLLTVVLLSVVATQGRVSGQEFSPTLFQQRRFSFYEIPILHIQITPIKRSGSTPMAATYIRQKSFLKRSTGTPNTWHLVSITRGLTGSTPADAKLLLDQLKIYRSGDPYWRKWSVDHPKHAAVLWPVIQRLAKRELYVLMPELFELAQIDQTPEQLTSQIDQFLQHQYQSLVQDMHAAQRDELAKQLLSESLADYPNDPELNKLRSELAPQPTE